MSKHWDGQMRERMAEELDAVELNKDTENRILNEIHNQVRKERRTIMKYPKKRLIIIVAAAIAAIGTMTAIAAGRIVGLSSGSKGTEAVHSAQELMAQAKQSLGADLYIAESLSDGSAFAQGYVKEVEGQDENGNTVMSYPEINAHYGTGGEFFLTAHKTVSGLPEEPMTAQTVINYNGVELTAKEDQYLFLPPDAEPSEADLKLQEEGKLAISYGSQTEEREVFRHIGWTRDGVEYLLSTFEDTSLDEMIGMAKAYIDGK